MNIKYIFTKTIKLILSVLLISTITFFILNKLPGSPLSSLNKAISPDIEKNFLIKHHLDLPLFKRYLFFMKETFINFNLGESLIYPGRRVNETILKYGTISFVLGFKGILFGTILGSIGAVLDIITRQKIVKNSINLLFLTLVSVPIFIVATTLYFIASNYFPNLELFSLEDNYTFMPSITIALVTSGIYFRYIKEALLNELDKDYIIMAKLKGYSRFKLFKTHILRNATLPLITLLMPQIAGLFLGFYVVENIFSVQGFGSFYISSINNRDYNMVLGSTLFFTIFYIVSTYVTDIIYILIDPRLRRKNEK